MVCFPQFKWIRSVCKVYTTTQKWVLSVLRVVASELRTLPLARATITLALQLRSTAFLLTSTCVRGKFNRDIYIHTIVSVALRGTPTRTHQCASCVVSVKNKLSSFERNRLSTQVSTLQPCMIQVKQIGQIKHFLSDLAHFGNRATKNLFISGRVRSAPPPISIDTFTTVTLKTSVL